MKQCKKLMSVFMLVCMANVSLAASNVVVFDVQGAILATDSAQKTLEKLRSNSDYAALQARAESLKSDLEELQKEGETKGMTWSADQVAAHRKKMESVSGDFQYTAKKIQSEQRAVVERLMREMQPQVEKALGEVVKAQGADLVLDIQTAYWASPKANITEEVTAKLNQAE